MTVEIIIGDCREELAKLPAESVHCCVTSPPYFGLRDYGVDGQIGLEDSLETYIETMVAVFREVQRVLRKDGTVWLNLGDSYAGSTNTGGTKSIQGSVKRMGAMNGHKRGLYGLKAKDLMMVPARVALALQADGWLLRSEIVWSKPNPMPESVTDRPTSAHEKVYLFSKCAWRGIENRLNLSEPDAVWLAAMIDAEGSVCINRKREGKRQKNPTYAARICCYNTHRPIIERIVDLTGVGSCKARNDCPGRVVYQWQVAGPKTIPVLDAIEPYLMAKRQQAWLALELQTMPKTHGNRSGFGNGSNPKSSATIAREEDIYSGCSSLNKTGETSVEIRQWKRGQLRPQPYYFDAEAVRQPAKRPNWSYETATTPGNNNRNDGGCTQRKDKQRGHSRRHAGFNDRWDQMSRDEQQSLGPNLRNVWNIATAPFPEAHFATFPPALVEPCIKAGTSEKGCCAECGAPWVREVKKTGGTTGKSWHDHVDDERRGMRTDKRCASEGWESGDYKIQTLGWSPSCACGVDCIPATVLDPFAGAGTTGLVADRLGRNAVLIELNPDYIDMARERIIRDGPLFADVLATRPTTC